MQTIITSLLLRPVRFSGHAQLRLSRKKGNAMTVRMIALCGAATLAIAANPAWADEGGDVRSEEHTSELQSLMRISYAVFCLQKKKQHDNTSKTETPHSKNN